MKTLHLSKIKQQVKRLKTELYALYLVYRDPRISWYARILIACVVGYAFSPIDLIPDFIPILDTFILSIKKIRPPKLRTVY